MYFFRAASFVPHLVATSLIPILLAGCESSRSKNSDATVHTDAAPSSDVPTSKDASSSSDTAAASGSLDGSITSDATAGGVDVSAGGGDAGERNDSAVCARWSADRTIDEGTWSGDIEACDAGDTSPDGRANALRIVNLYRWLAGFPEVDTAATLDAKAQQCALMMAANQQLSHDPSPDWKCYTTAGADAAGQSNISTQPGVASVDAYMVDSGNETTMGHRRWILSDGFGPIGLGSTSTASCMVVFGEGASAGPASGATFSAWPPPGAVPLAAIYPDTFPWSNVDETGWTVQTDVFDLTGATVAVTSDGAALDVDVSPLGQGYGSWTALRIVPQGWQSQAGKAYHVAVTVGGEVVIEYDVRMLACAS